MRKLLVGKVKRNVETIMFRGYYFGKYLSVKMSGKSIVVNNNKFYIEGNKTSLEESHSKEQKNKGVLRHEMYIINVLDIPIKKALNL